MIDRDGAAEEEDAQPEHARERPMTDGVVRRERDGPSEQLDSSIVIQVVGQLYTLAAQIPAGFLSGLCCNGQGRTYRYDDNRQRRECPEPTWPHAAMISGWPARLRRTRAHVSQEDRCQQEEREENGATR